MKIPLGNLPDLRTCLREMAEVGLIVTETNGKEFVLIAIPENLLDQQEGAMPAPKGYRRTTQPRDNAGVAYPAHLGSDKVGPLTITGSNAHQNIAAGGQLVLEELAAAGTRRYERHELLQSITGLLAPLYDAAPPEVMQSLSGQVLSWMLTAGHARHVTGGHDLLEVVPPAATASVRRPEDRSRDLVEMLGQLAQSLEAARAENARLRTGMDAMVDREQYAKVKVRCSDLLKANAELRRQVKAVKEDFAAAQRRIGELEAATENIVPPELRQRVEKLIGE